MVEKNKNNKTTANEQAANEQYTAKQRELYAAASKLLQFGNLLKDAVVTYTQYTKANYRNYVQNPKRNEKDLRAMSQFLARVSMPYKRILWYFASIYSFHWNLMPKLDPTNLPDYDAVMKSYNEACLNIEKLDISQEGVNINFFALRDGAFYGVLYEDDKTAFIHRLNPDYCKPVQLEAGCFNFAFDFAYFKKYPEALETWDPMFKTGFNAYEKDSTNMRWQILDPERTICIKADPELDEVLPFFIGIFEALLDLIDARTLQRNKDIVQNYKLIVQKVPLFDEDAGKTLDDFRLRLDTALKFSQQLNDNLPEAVGSVTSPMEIDTVDFKTDDNSNTLVSSSMKQIFDDSGVSQLIMNSNTTGSVGVEASIKVDTALSWTLVKSIERWLRRYLAYRTTSIEFDFEILDVNIFNKDTAVDRELKLANSGVPNKMKLAATAGISPMQVISNQIFENQFLEFHKNWIPLQTSYTMSSDDAGRPANDDGKVNDSTSKNKDSGEDESNAIE